MSLKIKRTTKTKLKQIAVGLLCVAVIFVFAFFGSSAKRAGSHSTLILASNADYNVSVDEVSALYVMSNAASSVGLPSEDVVLASYYNAKVQYATNQYSASLGKIEKPVITNVVGVSQGVVAYVVQPGDTVDSIIAELHIPGLTSDQIRWSNGMKTADISEGSTLYLPNTAGIVYVVKAGEDVNWVASKYGSTTADICSANYLGDNCAVSEGLRIVIPGGVLPENERPEYVAPVSTPTYSSNSTTNSSYYYSVSYGGNGYYAGQCTWFAWNWRHDNGFGDLPRNLGNAYSWGVNAAAAGYLVDGNPSYGAVFVDLYSGWGYGHVGIVTGINSDGSLNITDMNYAGAFVVTNRTVPSSTWSRWQFIH